MPEMQTFTKHLASAAPVPLSAGSSCKAQGFPWNVARCSSCPGLPSAATPRTDTWKRPELHDYIGGCFRCSGSAPIYSGCTACRSGVGIPASSMQHSTHCCLTNEPLPQSLRTTTLAGCTSLHVLAVRQLANSSLTACNDEQSLPPRMRWAQEYMVVGAPALSHPPPQGAARRTPHILPGCRTPGWPLPASDQVPRALSVFHSFWDQGAPQGSLVVVSLWS